MRAFPNWDLFLASLLAASFLPVLASPNARLKQATRAEVVSRVRRGPVAPRTSTCITPSGTAPTSVGDVWIYDLFYSGSGYTENPNNPGSYDPTGGDFSTMTSTFGYTDIATAIETCADLAASSVVVGGQTFVYSSFDLSFYTSTCTWSCTFYGNINHDSSYFNVANTDVALGYGYSSAD